jgi:colanic acid/amylovoran biosynthesis glycosyltransferase
MRLAYLTTHFPFSSDFSHNEAFLEPEVRSLAKYVDALYVIATRPKQRSSVFPDLGSTNIYMEAFGVATLAGAWREFVRHPARVAAALGAVLLPRYRLIAKIKNLVLFPKALALADTLRSLGVDHIHTQWLTTPGTTAYVASRLTGIPWSCTAHQHDIFLDNLIPQKVASAQFVRVISERNRKHLIELVDPASAERTCMIHLGVEIPEVYSPPVSRDRLELLCAARLDPMKGHQYLLEALSRVVARGLEIHCTIAGEGVLRDRIRARIDALGLGEVVTMRGAVPHAMLLRELHTGMYDAVVIASTEKPGEHEGIPVAIMEAMASGVPCISTRTGSLEELIDGDNGILVPQRDPAAMAEAIARIAADPALRARMGRLARARIVEQFHSARTTAQLYRLIVRGAERPDVVEPELQLI